MYEIVIPLSMCNLQLIVETSILVNLEAVQENE